MIDLDISFVIQLVNFIITLLVLNLLLIKPVRGVIKKRNDLMAGRVDEINKFTGSAETKIADYEAQLAAARKEGVDIRNAKKDEGSAEEHTIMETAGKNTAATMKAAREEITSQSGAAMTALKGDVDKYAKQVTDKILGQA